MNSIPMYVDGKLQHTNKTEPVVNPATDETIVNICISDIEIANTALKCARNAELTWGKADLYIRIKWMNKLAEAIKSNETALRKAVQQETGKTWAGTEEDFNMLIESLSYYSSIVAQHFTPEITQDDTHKHIITKQGVGVCVAYLAWNFPLLNIGYKIGPAMAAGCPLIIKPSMKTPYSAYLLGAICDSIDLPKGAIQILAGDDRELGTHMSSSTIPAMLTLIGSTQTGMSVMRDGTTSIKRHSMELGGDAPFIVCSDADLDVAADTLVSIKYGNSGQICVSANRIFVEKCIFNDFKKKVLNRTQKVKLGFGSDDITMGPLIDRQARERVHQLVIDAISDGATLLTGGDFNHREVGAFYPPTVLENVTDDMRICKEEIFGPVIALGKFSELEEVIERSNSTVAGLASYIFTSDSEKASYLAERLNFGEVQVNGIKYAINLPHTGIKQSGIGCDCSEYALDDYLVLKRTTIAIR
ncbi:aldehyde dehydrogenase family protein [Vibrio mediterranei]